MIPEEVKADLKKKAEGITAKTFFDLYSYNGYINCVFMCNKPIFQTEIIVDHDSEGFAIDQSLLRIEYKLTRSMVYDILNS